MYRPSGLVYGRHHTIAMTIAIVTLAILALVVAGLFDRLRWRKKSREELLALITGGDWQRWKPAIKELGRRGDAIEQYAVWPLNGLTADSKMIREAARVTLVDLYPEIGIKLKACAYRSVDDVETCRQKLASMLMQKAAGL